MMKTRLKTLSRRSISTILAILMVFSCLMVGTISANADNSVTFYIYPSDLWSDYASYTIKAIANIGDNNTWWEYQFTNTNKTINGKVVYTVTINERYGGVDALKIIKYNGNNNVAEKQPYSSWTTSGTFSGKIYNGSTWANLPAYDITRAVVAGDIASNGWNNTSDEMTASSGTFTKTYTSKAKGSYTFAVFEYGNWDRSYRWAAKGTLTANNCGSWADANDGDHNIKLTLTKKADVTITFSVSTSKVDVTINPVTHDVTRTAPTNGALQLSKTSSTSGFGTSTIAVPEGDKYWVKATPNTGYKISDLTVGGSAVSAAAGKTSAYTYEGTMGTSDVATSVTFAKQTYTVSYNKGSNGTGTNTSDTKTYGTDLTLKGAIFTRTGYTQTGWNTNSSGSGGTHYSLSGSYTNNAAVTLYPEWTQNTYTVTFSESGATGGTLKVDNTAFTSGSTVTHGSHTFSITAPSNFNVQSVTGIGNDSWTGLGTGTASLGSTSVTGAITISVTYVSATQPGVTITANYNNSSNKANIGNTVTVTAEKTHANSGSGAMSISVTRDGSAATANTDYTVTSSTSGAVTTYTIVPLKAGVFVVTASYTDTGNPSNSVTFGVNTPIISVTDKNMTIGENLAVTPSTLSNPSSTGSGWSVTYSSGNTSKVSVSGNTLSAKATGTVTITAYYKYNNTTKAQTTFTVAVAKSDLAITNNDPSVNRSYFLTGDSNDKLSVTSTPTITSKTWQSSDSSVFTVASDGTITAVAAGNATLTVTATFSNGGVDTATADIYVQNPTLSVDKNSLSLDYISDTTNAGSDYKNTDTFSVSTNANNTAYASHTDVTVTSSDTSVVTVNKGSITGTSPSDRTVTATSHAVGTATITVKYYLHNTELTSLRKTINITVSDYDTEVAVYLNASTGYNRNGTSDSTIYFIPGTSANAGSGGVAMTKIGQTNSTHNVWAIKITKKQYYNTNGFYFGTDTSIKSENNRNTTKITGSNPIKNYFVTSDTGSNGVWHGTTVSSSSTIAITKPVIGQKVNETVGHLKTKSATAPTISNGVTPSSYVWTSATTSVAGISGTGATPSITGNALGTSNATVRAFIPLVNTGITFSSLETSTAAAYDFIASDEKGFTITVEEVYYTITVVACSKAKSSDDYSSNPSAMDSYTVKDNGTVSSTFQVAAGHTATVTATPASTGYKLQGYNSNSLGNGTSYSNGQINNVQEDKTVYVLFHQKYNISYSYHAGYLNNPPATSNTVFADTTPGNITLQIKAGFYLDWANSTNLNKYYNEPSTKTGNVSLTSKQATSIDAGDKIDTDVTIAIAAYPTVNVTYYVDTHRTGGTAPQIKFCDSDGSDLNKADGTGTTTYEYEQLSQKNGTVYSKQIATPYYSNNSIYASVTVNGIERQVTLGTRMTTTNEVWLDVVNQDKISVTKTNTTPNSTNSYPAVASGSKRIYLKQASDMGNNWSSTCIYYWNDDISNLAPSWESAPAMTKLGTDNAGNTYYRADIPEDAAEIIFKGSNNEQSVDVPLNNNNYFELTKNSSNTKNHNVEALDKMIIPTVTSAPTTVDSPLREEDGGAFSTFSVKPVTYSGSSISYTSNNTSVVIVNGDNGVATAYGNGTTTITVRVKSAVGDVITNVNGTNYEYFEYNVTVNIVDSNIASAVNVMSYESNTSYYYIENYSTPANTNATITNISTALTLGTASSSRDYTGAGIITQTLTRNSDSAAIGYSVKYAKLGNNPTDYTTINLDVTLTTKADSYDSTTQRYGFKEWHDNTTPTPNSYNEAQSSYKTYKDGNNVLVDMTLPHNGKTFTAVYELYSFVDAQINYNYYEYKTVRYAGTENEVEKNYYDADWACDPKDWVEGTNITTNPNTYYTNNRGFQASHTLKTYATENIEYRSNTQHSNSDLSNKNLISLFSNRNADAQARAMIDLNIKRFISDFYDYSPYYSGIEYSYNNSTNVATINIYLYGTPRTYSVTCADLDVPSVTADENGNPIYYQSWVNLTSNNGSKKWLVNGTTVAIGDGYRFRVTGDTEVTTAAVTLTDAALSGKTVPQHANSTLSGDGTSTQQLTQSFYIQDFFDKTFYKYNDANDNNTEKEYDEITFVGGGVAYYSYNRAAGVPIANATLTNNALLGKNYVELNQQKGYVAKTHKITRNDLLSDSSTNAYGVEGTATYIGDRIQYLIEKNKTDTGDEAYDLANAYATEISGRQDTDDDNNTVKTGLMYRYLPYEQKYSLDANGDPEESLKTNSNIYRYSSQQQAYQFLYRLTMANKKSNSNGYMRLYSFMVFSYRDYAFTDEPDGEVKYVLVLSDNYADAPRYYTVSI